MQYKNLILAAACKFYLFDKVTGDFVKEITLVDSFHFGNNMQETLKVLEQHYDVRDAVNLPDLGQGFVDSSSNYHDRAEAYIIAKASGQQFNDEFTHAGNKLDSSCIRRIPVDLLPKAWSCHYCDGTVYVDSDEICECSGCGELYSLEELAE